MANPEDPSTWLNALDVSLRSSNPRSQLEEIIRISLKLRRWGTTQSLLSDPCPPSPYVNSIFLRLGDAFKSGNNLIRQFILKFFLFQVSELTENWHNNILKALDHLRVNSESQDLKKLLQDYYSTEKNVNFGEGNDLDSVCGFHCGLLSPDFILNPSLLLKQIKSVARTQDLESRIISIRMIGCLAWIAKDDLESFQIVLEGLDSKIDDEIQASLFASRFLGPVSLEFARNMVTKVSRVADSAEVSLHGRIVATCLLSQCCSSSSLAFKTFQMAREFNIKAMKPIQASLLFTSMTIICIEVEPLVHSVITFLVSHLKAGTHDFLRRVALVCLARIADVATNGTKLVYNDLEPLVKLALDQDTPVGTIALALETLDEFSGNEALVKDMARDEKLMIFFPHISDMCDQQVLLASVSLWTSLYTSQSNSTTESTSKKRKFPETTGVEQNDEVGADPDPKETSNSVAKTGALSLFAAGQLVDILCTRLFTLVQNAFRTVEDGVGLRGSLPGQVKEILGLLTGLLEIELNQATYIVHVLVRVIEFCRFVTEEVKLSCREMLVSLQTDMWRFIGFLYRRFYIEKNQLGSDVVSTIKVVLEKYGCEEIATLILSSV